MTVTGFSIHLKSALGRQTSSSATPSFKRCTFSLMHTFKNLVKHKRSSTCFCGTERGKGVEERKEVGDGGG